jgi:hypothetical protein
VRADPDQEAQVLAFIAERRAAVLGRAVDAIAAADEPNADPPLDRVAHRLVGTLGSYGLDQAVEVVEDLRAGRCDVPSAVAALRSLARDGVA